MTNPRYIINFPTKRHWRGKSRMEDIEAGLVALVAEIGARGIRCDDLSQVGATLESVLDTDGPVLIEIPNTFGHPGYGSFGRWDD